jgi:hypothetical protein
MKKVIFPIVAGLVVFLTGCVGTVTQTKPGLPPNYQDRVAVRYEHSVERVFAAAKNALNSFGHISREAEIFSETTAIRTIEGGINRNAIYIRIEGQGPRASTAVVQVRTKSGGTDLRVAADLQKNIATWLNN